MDDLIQEQALQRMKDGAETILKLHNPYELSSICGMLGLKTQQKGPTSLKQIMDWAMEDGVISENKVYSLEIIIPYFILF